MLDFKPLTLSDIPLLRSFFVRYPERICDCAVGSTFMWRNYFDNSFAVVDDTLICMAGFPHGETAFTCPIGKNPAAAFDAIEQFCIARSHRLIFSSVPETKLPVLLQRYPGAEVSYSEDWMDYLYDSEALLTLAGRKFATQRNHINKFLRLYGDYSFESLNDSLQGKVLSFLEAFEFNSEKADESAALEIEMCKEVISNYKDYSLPCGVLTVGSDVIGFSVGEIIGDTIFIHIEKADTSYQGSYPMLTNSFLKMFLTPEVRFVNREEDVGDEGLRKSKQSYHPVEMLKKYTVIKK